MKNKDYTHTEMAQMPIIGFYILRTVLIISFIVSIGLSIYTLYTVKQYISEIEQYRIYISQLNQVLLDNTYQDSSSIIIQMPEYRYISGTEKENINFADAVAILQTQQEQYSNNVNIMFTVLSIVITTVTIVIPIFNYVFIQKEHIDKIEIFSKRLSRQEKNRQNEYNKLKQHQEAQLDSLRTDYLKLIEELQKEVTKLTINYNKIIESKNSNPNDRIDNDIEPTLKRHLNFPTTSQKHIQTINPPIDYIDNKD